MSKRARKYLIDKEKDRELWDEVFASARGRTLKEIERYCSRYSRPFRSAQLYLFIRHELTQLGLKMSDFLDMLEDDGDLYIETLPQSGKRVILNEDIKEIAEESGPYGLPNYLAKYEQGKLDFTPEEN